MTPKRWRYELAYVRAHIMAAKAKRLRDKPYEGAKPIGVERPRRLESVINAKGVETDTPGDCARNPKRGRR